ncbi:peptidylglycine alpha-hydroxylating monooxygenase-like [Branchiostoma floridae]|uniref:peptidylglycine monooxygenase n=1 Tax=Branchiostoma floridae TaxID=7739 RepID=A0A9J7KP40_BRAFL|nr:peptidylglycine alpha-hydroxylating monooxygenase-like [Branchiostoma floridae]
MADARRGWWLGLLLVVTVWGAPGRSQKWLEDLDDPEYRRDGSEYSVDIRMPDVSPEKHDTYLCYKVPLDQKEPSYIVGFEPKVEDHAAHHILLYGCEVPGSADKDLWNCGEMSGSTIHPTCQQGAQILYAWAMDAPELKLPKDVGFKIGGNTDVKYLVLQVHYNDVTKFKGGATDESGVGLRVTDTPQKYMAGVYLLGVGAGAIPAHSTANLDTACLYRDEPVLHPFAFRVHAHKLGAVVSGYRVRQDKWTLIGKKSPQRPQMFYPVSDKTLTIKNGDILAARCSYKSDLDHTVRIGATGSDEMCNFYIMYYTTSRRPLEQNMCFRAGFHWEGALQNIPEEADYP